MFWSWLVLLLCTASLAGVLCGSFSVSSDGHFTDAAGRIRLFHGTNAVYKMPPYHPPTDSFDPYYSLSDQDIDLMLGMGHNSVRLGMMWPGVETAQGVYNASYIAEMVKIVNKLGARGIYSILDAHQDVLSRFFCGEGAPDYVAKFGLSDPHPFPAPLNIPPIPTDPNTGYPNLTDCLTHNFFDYYNAHQAGKAFTGLWTNQNGVAASFAQMWGQVAKAFAGNPYVIGYEIINEPWPGDMDAEPILRVPGWADKHRLQPVYDMVAEAIFAQDPEALVFFEPVLVEGACGFSAGPGGESKKRNNVLSFHVYCGGSAPNGDILNVTQCEDIFHDTVDTRISDRKRLGVGAYMTEFGANANDKMGIIGMNLVMDQADRVFVSWNYWQFKFFADITTQSNYIEGVFWPNGTLQANKVQALSRPFAQSIAGTPVSAAFDTSTKIFTLVYAANPEIEEPTVITASPYVYPRGYSWSGANALCTASADSVLLSCTVLSHVVAGQQITITITPD